MDWEQKRTDQNLTAFYEGNGLFAKIIDTPAEECFRCGFKILGNVPNDGIENAMELLDALHWEEIATTAVKWARLFGGALVVMLIDDGCGIEEPLRLENVHSVDGLVVYDRSIVRPYSVGVDGSSHQMREYYQVFSHYGTFTVHASRCLVFRNGDKLPEQSAGRQLWPWGIPEAFRIAKEVQNAEVSNGNAARMLEKATQPVHKIRGLAQKMATEDGEAQIRRQMDIADFARGLFNTVVIDSEDDFDFVGEIPEGIKYVLDVPKRALSAVCGIPDIVLWGRRTIIDPRSRPKWRKQDKETMEQWYSFVHRIQVGMVKNNLWRLLSILFQAGVNSGELSILPKFDIEFNPLWSIDDLEQADIGLKKAEAQRAKAQTAALYVKMGSLKPSEIRKGLFRKSRRK